MKRNMTKTMALVFIGLTLLTGLAWLSNIDVAKQWNPMNGHEQAYTGIVPWLDWAAVDFSTVSTLIPFFGCLLITAGLFRTAYAKKNTNISEFFPFFKTYASITVALGLMGTIWGLIMIGYYPADKVQMSDLILCLRTALYSTLVALVWVFLVVYPIRFVMQRWYRSVSGYRDIGGTGNILGLLKDLGSSVRQSIDEIQGACSEFTKLNVQVSEITAGLAGLLEPLNGVRARADALFDVNTKTLGQMQAESVERQKLVEQQKLAMEKLQGVVEVISEKLQESIAQLDEVRQERDESNARLVAVQDLVGAG